eukprot:2566892-Prymnesium_polylepis.1
MVYAHLGDITSMGCDQNGHGPGDQGRWAGGGSPAARRAGGGSVGELSPPSHSRRVRSARDSAGEGGTR